MIVLVKAVFEICGAADIDFVRSAEASEDIDVMPAVLLRSAWRLSFGETFFFAPPMRGSFLRSPPCVCRGAKKNGDNRWWNRRSHT